MKTKLPGHLVNGLEWREWDDYENYIFEDEKRIITYSGYRDTPSKKECDRLCEKYSSKVKIIKYHQR